MSNALDKLTIKGFKSIKSLEDFELGKLNVMIGGNGAGKSNFIEIFRMLKAVVDGNFANFITLRGGADDFMFNGPKITQIIEVEILFGEVAYSFELEPTVSNDFLMKSVTKRIVNEGKITGSRNRESQLTSIKHVISSWVVYHFHDTSATAPMRRYEITADNARLRSDAANIAPFLLKLREKHIDVYNEITETVRLVTPFFDEFLLDVQEFGEKQKVNLSWRQKGSDYPMQPYHFSDGTIRFICLATALLQPDPPSTIVIDEPELGLHPFAINILGELVQSASKKTQIIIATQSPAFIDNFSIEDIIVVNRKDGASTFERLKEKDFDVWLEDYSVGELWSKNVIPGGAVHE